MIYSKWSIEDILDIYELEKECFDNPWTFEMLSSTFLNDNFLGYLAKLDGKIVGYVALVHCLDEADINIVAVDTNFRKRGIATNLLNLCHEELIKKGVKKVFLEVRKGNEKAKLLYEKLGYELISIRPLYYEGKEDALIMRKFL